MKYDLARQLRDAGFPEGGKGSWLLPSDALVGRNSDRVYQPTLEELIEACGDKFGNLILGKNGQWEASSSELGQWAKVIAATPADALGNLWLALNKTA